MGYGGLTYRFGVGNSDYSTGGRGTSTQVGVDIRRLWYADVQLRQFGRVVGRAQTPTVFSTDAYHFCT
jgi:hypothetical protein